ncbi:DUF3060 domain-containing protein [Nocardioides baculatus]|uniref:DUF3060 domain-containing protein n=1 Tax=Nocardioides baculatus TaxID=2801337 RepID=A0ABS1L948_9ACTN|nr:DUF3060 domain-containing protein [Nocardioides baculatus]MBL0748052.1 DUF3060 domain-containing protein [Nocardioides baculatus]
MTIPRFVAALALTATGLAAGLSAAPAQAIGLTIPVQCELGAETVLSWDGATYDLRGTCGVVRVVADDATVTMPSATRLVLDGSGSTVTAKPVYDVEVAGPGNTLTTPSITSLVVTGTGSTVTVSGLVESAELTSSGSMLGADTVNVLRMRGTDAVHARKAYRTRITGSDNSLSLTRADRLVLTGARNTVSVARGRTTLRDRGEANVLDLRPRRRQ